MILKPVILYSAIRNWMAICLAMVCCMTANAGPNSDPRINPSALIKRQVFGEWKDAHRSGLLRYSLYEGGSEEVETILVVEWIAIDKKTGSHKLVAQREIIPIQGVFKPPQIVSSKPYTLRIAVGTIFCDKLLKYDIQLTGIGKYKQKQLNYEKSCDPLGPDHQ